MSLKLDNFKICSKIRAITETEAKPGFWNVISIGTEEEGWPRLSHAKNVWKFAFDDVESAPLGAKFKLPDGHDIREILSISDRYRDEPLMIHCHAGISRSTASMFICLLKRLYPAPNAISEALCATIGMQPHLYPNRLIVELGMSQIVGQDQLIAKTRELYALPEWQKIFSQRF